MTSNFLIFPYDYILSILVLIITIFSTWKGFIQSILGLLTWIGSILITIYSYDSSSIFISSQILKIEFFQNYEYFTHILSIIISIPLIFLLSLFFLKKIRKFLSSDIDKQLLGIVFDKIFGFIYGLLFSYVIITAFIILINSIEMYNLKNWINNNSNIILNINNFNQNYIYGIDLINTINE